MSSTDLSRERYARPADNAESQSRVHAQGVTPAGRDSRPPAPTTGITRFRECGVCRLRKTCSVDLKGRWLCIECKGCLDG